MTTYELGVDAMSRDWVAAVILALSD